MRPVGDGVLSYFDRRGRIELSSAQLRETKKLGKQVKRALQSDKLFFERRPERMHRVRLSHSAEVRQNEIAAGAPRCAKRRRSTLHEDHAHGPERESF